jgi:hypothetical protein
MLWLVSERSVPTKNVIQITSKCDSTRRRAFAVIATITFTWRQVNNVFPYMLCLVDGNCVSALQYICTAWR